MSQQQEMESGRFYQGERTSYEGYEGLPPYHDDPSSIYAEGSKITGAAASQRATANDPYWAPRLGLIIVSLLSWMLFFFVAIAIMIINPAPHIAGIVDPLLFVGLTVFTAMLIAGNMLFNLKH